jgi:hypothetical protein
MMIDGWIDCVLNFLIVIWIDSFPKDSIPVAAISLKNAVRTSWNNPPG